MIRLDEESRTPSNPLVNTGAIATTDLIKGCDLYTFAGEWAFNVGIPAKSGVSGGILAVVPGQMGIGVYSPLVDSHGNSVRGIRLFQDLARELNLHIFECND